MATTRKNNGETEQRSQVVTTASEGCGYRYASLADMAHQGVKIPKMKIGIAENNLEYVYYWDDEVGDWIQGARVVVPLMKSANEAQMYGSAVTYARRVTTAMAAGIATEDDKNLERHRNDRGSRLEHPSVQARRLEPVATPASEEMVAKIYDLAAEGDYPAERLAAAVAWASDGRTQTVEELAGTEAAKLVGQMATLVGQQKRAAEGEEAESGQ